MHAHYLTFLIHLATWWAVKLGIFSQFTSTNFSWHSQSNNLTNVYILYRFLVAFYKCLKTVVFVQSWSHFFILPLPQNKILYYLLPKDNTISYAKQPYKPFFLRKKILTDSGDLIGPHSAEGSNQTRHFLLLDLNKELYRWFSPDTTSDSGSVMQFTHQWVCCFELWKIYYYIFLGLKLHH